MQEDIQEEVAPGSLEPLSGARPLKAPFTFPSPLSSPSWEFPGGVLDCLVALLGRYTWGVFRGVGDLWGVLGRLVWLAWFGQPPSFCRFLANTSGNRSKGAWL